MSWLFSRALVEAFSEATCSDGAQSVLSSGSHTPQAYLPPDRMTAFSRPSRFGMTFSPLTADLGAAVLMWCLEASRAKTSALQEKEPESTEPDQACGPTWRGSLARFDPATSSWKTAQPSLLGDSHESLVTWPRSGMTANGQCWELPTLGRRISGIGSGLSPDGVRTFHTPNTGGLDGGSNSRRALAKKASWPTPQTRGFTNDGDLMALGKMCDSWEEMSAMAYRASEKKKAMYWPTPTNQGHDAGGTDPRRSLYTAVRSMVATPTARDWRSGKASQATMERNSRPLSEQIGGSLNPTWVEWLMGWPLGWTDLKPLETAKSHSALQQHGDY